MAAMNKEMKKLSLVALLLFLLNLVSAQTRSMCAHQIALVSQTCIMIPWRGGPPPSSSSSSSSTVVTLHDHGLDHHHHGHNHGHGHSHMHHHSHGHHHHHHHGSNPEEECCRWLGELDSVCVCDLLIRLPRFLTKPNHTISVTVGNACNATYSCPGI